MDCIIEKQVSNQVKGWSPRVYRLRNCELIQYKKSVESFQECTDKLIKKRYNLCDAKAIGNKAGSPYKINIIFGDINKLDYTQPKQDSNNVVRLKFNRKSTNKNNDKDEEINPLEFKAFWKLSTAMVSPLELQQSKYRPIPSQIQFALYYLLQKLYKHENIFSTPYIFQKRLARTSSNKHVEKEYYNLIVNYKTYLNQKIKQNYGDIHLLTKTLIFTLQQMPSSLFCDPYCELLVNHTIRCLQIAEVCLFVIIC